MGIKTKKHDSNITKIPKNTVRQRRSFRFPEGLRRAIMACKSNNQNDTRDFFARGSLFMEEKARVLQKLEALGIAYAMDVHEPVYTIEAMVALGLDKKGEIVKNLFLRDAKGKRHFLVMLPGSRQGDLKAIRGQLGSTALSFGSEERLMRCLKLTQGAVSPLGVLNDADRTVEVVIDRTLVGAERLGVHPNDNTATLWLSYEGLRKVIDHCGNTVHPIDL